MRTAEFLQTIRDLIVAGRLAEALEQLRTLLENSPQKNEALHLSSRFAQLERENRMGILDTREAMITRNQITAGLLDLLSSIESRQDLPEVKADIERAIIIINSKNVVVNSNINAGGNVHIGDKNVTQNADKIYNIDKIDNANFS